MTELHGKNGEPSIRERTGQLKVGFMERLHLFRAPRKSALFVYARVGLAGFSVCLMGAYGSSNYAT